MPRNILIYSCAVLCLFILAGCGEAPVDNMATLTVTCADIDSPEGDALKRWSGEYDTSTDLNLSAIIEMDSSSGGEVLFESENYHIISLEINRTEPDADVTVWYRKHTYSSSYLLSALYRGFPGEDRIRDDARLENVSGGQTIDDDFLAANQLLPAIENYGYDHFTLGDIVMEESATITIWYYKFYKVTVKYELAWSGTEISPPRTLLLKHGRPLTANLLIDEGYVDDIQGYSNPYVEIIDKFITDDTEVIIRYF